MSEVAKRTIVRGRWVITDAYAPVIDDGAVLVEGDRIAAVGKFAEISALYPGVSVLGSAESALIPGLSNAHHHSWAATPVQHGRRDQPLEAWILAGKSRRQSDPYLDTLVSAARLLGAGITSVVDAYFGGGTAKQYAGDVAQVLAAYKESGLRAVLSTGIDTQSFLVWGQGEDSRFLAGLPPDLRAGAEALMPGPDEITGDEYLTIIEEIHAHHRDDARIDVWFGPGGPHWMSDDLLTRIAERAQAINTRVQTHCVETIYEREHGTRFYGKPTVLHLRDIGFLGPWLSLAHGVWVNDDEIGALAESGTSVVHNPSSNLRLRAGIAPVLAMRAAGITIGLGMDGFGFNDDEDIFTDMRLAQRLHGTPQLAGACLSAADVLGMATADNARLMGKGASLGRLAPGCLADLVILDLTRITAPWVAPEVDPVELIIARAKSGDVRTVMVGGEVVFADGKPTRFDAAAAEREACARYARQSFRVERDALVRQLAPHLAAWYRGWEHPAAETGAQR